MAGCAPTPKRGDLRPVTAKVSLRCMASKIEARVFSSAHAPVRAAGALGARVEKPTENVAGHAHQDHAVRNGMTTEEVVLAVGTPALCESDPAPNPNVYGFR